MNRWAPISKLVQQVKKGEISASELVELSLKIIEQNKEFNAIISILESRARDRAKKIDDEIKKGNTEGKLLGIPFIAKDNLLTFGAATTAASNILKDFTAPYQASVIDIIESEGGICVAKSNLDAFAHGTSTENSDFMTTKNPYNPQKVPGGSSGGSAAAVVLDMVPFALGTDTGGSIRTPAAFCGAVGYKPTYGLVSRNGVIAMASSTDVVGPLTRTVEDSAYILDVIAGKDKYDSTTIERDQRSYSDLETTISNIKIGVIKEHRGEGIDTGINNCISNVIKTLKSSGVEIIEVSLPSISLALACYYIICPAEVSSNLSRYDGQRYGYSNSKATSLDESYYWSRSEGFGKEAKRRIMIGTYVLSSGYYHAYYKQAQKLRTKLINEFDEAFKKCDFLIGPTTPTVAFGIGEKTSDPLQMYLSDIMTVGANLVGIPAISIPAGVINELPVGLQIMAPQQRDRQLLSISKFAESII